MGGKLLFLISILLGMLSSVLLWVPNPMSPGEVQERYGPWSVVIGGGEIGLAWVKELHSQGLDVILVTDQREFIDETMLSDINNNNNDDDGGVVVHSPIDYSVDNIVFFSNLTLNYDIGLVIVTSQTTESSAFIQSNLEIHHDLVNSNIKNSIDATYAMLSRFNESSRVSGIIFDGSVAALQGIQNKVIYAATKSFMVSFSLGLYEEFSSNLNIDILSCLSGDIISDWRVPTSDSTHQCLHALPLGMPSLAVGWFNRVLSLAIPYFPISVFGDSQ